MEFSGKTVLITGAASGIGFECCREFGKNGANIVMCDVNEAAMKEKSAKLEADGINVLTIKTDVRDYEEVKAACGAASRFTSRITSGRAAATSPKNSISTNFCWLLNAAQRL